MTLSPQTGDPASEEWVRSLYRRAAATVRERREDFARDFAGPDKPVAYMQSRHAELNIQLTLIEGLLIDVRERLTKLEKRLDGAMKYRGGFQRADEYKKGDAVTCDGSLWFCLRDVDGAEGKPGNQSVAQNWQMTTRAMK